MSEFTNKTAIITGGAQGMGYAYCQLLTAAGANVVIADTNQEKADEAARSLEGPGKAGPMSARRRAARPVFAVRKTPLAAWTS